MADLSASAQVEHALDEKRSFLVEAGAGSGKTHTLIHSLHHLLGHHRRDLEREGRNIACITYTNVAKKQISERIMNDPLVHVSTIHEFLWSVIRAFQKQLREQVLEYNESLRNPEDLADWSADVEIIYSDRGRRLREGRISHDEVLELAYQLVSTYPKLVRIIADRYPVIFVDEYQDTSPRTIQLLLDHLAGVRQKRCVVGLFGDSMQKIYRHGVGAVEHEKLTRITKYENHRCSEPVVAVLNKIRPELPQHAVAEQREGEVHLFLNADVPPGAERLKSARETLEAKGWSTQDTKYLMLTHRGIAGTLDYANVLKLYTKLGPYGRDDLMEGTDPFAQYMLQIELLCRSYETKDYAELSRLLETGAMAITHHSRKAEIARAMRELLDLRQSATIGEVFDLVHESGLLRKPGKVRAVERTLSSTDLEERAQRKADFALGLRALPYLEAIAYVQYRNELTPFATQHGVKGDEFENVVVVIDDGAWTQYDMGKMLAKTDQEQRTQRSRNLFYVCCSRAKRRLAVVFMTDLPPGAETVAQNWFASGTIHP
ncbi:UvrD-helicase domain-containing protein [Sphaerisporangium sp. NPDC049003]|uniref:UvrD-helicase domain-containing protein n=1 Tax=Sphaerisporangium sp. NPDC049003 TaxID=3364517 RepID=UPI0037166552